MDAAMAPPVFNENARVPETIFRRFLFVVDP